MTSSSETGGGRQRLADKVILVTGAARGLGRIYCEVLAGHGAPVVAADVNDCSATVEAVTGAGGQAVAVTLDVTDPDSCRAAVEAATDRFGRLDGLVNNAALYATLSSAPIEALPDDEWHAAMAVNVTGVFNMCRAAVPALREAGGGSIVNVSSLAAVYGMANSLHYTTSKAAVLGLTRGLARELGRHWIRVNAIAPSAVRTEGTEEFFGDKHDKALEIIASQQAIRRNLDPTDVAGTVVYLMSDESRFITAQTLMVDGGTIAT
ncbi:MAG: SDR family oxidoreductase [Acidimicrobiia bacterium]|nr:SDR family oxidoreductase [Acidimicrobiia bacterium]